MHVVKFPLGVIHLIEPRSLGLFDVYDCDSIFSVRDVSVRARDVNIVSFSE
jgi:hypothetical protein